jgi:molybdate transport system substrate-binding protein
MSALRLTGISSMATRALLADLATAYRQSSGIDVSFQSMGGVDAARRVEAGEAFDLVVLAADAIDKLVASGRAAAGSRTDLVHSAVAVAVRAGAPRPDLGSEDALRQSVRSARSIGYSTGPSGAALLRLFERWGIADLVRARLVQAPPGVPVGTLVARGDVELGFQQRSELMHLPGIDLVGGMPAGAQILTTFSAALCSASTQPGAVRELLAYLQSPDTVALKQRHGFEPA